MPYQSKFNPKNPDAFKLSRSKVELYLNCNRCFYLDRKLGIGRPPGFPFNLNSAVDSLLKNEFDHYRNLQEPHPFMERTNFNLVPFQHEDLNKWRANFTGISFLHQQTNFLLYGAVDDIWYNKDNEEIIIVDYKSTSKNGEITLDSDWQISYKNQMEFYQYLFRKNGFKVSDTGFFVYCNGNSKEPFFNQLLKFDVSIIPYIGSAEWIDGTILEIHSLLNQDFIPETNSECEYCNYIQKSINLN